MTRAVIAAAALSLAFLGAARADDTSDALVFRRVADTGLPAAGTTFGGTWAHLDADDHWDLVLSRHADDLVEFYLGHGDLTFRGPVEAATPTGLLDHHGTAACDHDGDGDWDLFLSVGADRGHARSCKHLWRCEEPLTFHDVIGCDHPLADPGGRGRGALWLRLTDAPEPQLLLVNYASPARLFGRLDGAWRDLASWFADPGPGDAHVALADDLDGDGRLDLLTAGQECRLWRNQDGRLVRPVAGAIPVAIRPLGDAASGDVDGDGAPDLLLALRGGALWVLRNRSEPGRFAFARPLYYPDVPLVNEPVSVALADLDNDGHLDLAVAHRAADRGLAPILSRGRGDGTFARPLRLDAVPSRAMALWAIDLDRDGDLDLVAINGEEVGGEPRGTTLVYENLAARPGVTVELVAGPGQAPHGLGARVTLEVDGRARTRVVRSVANPWNSTVLPVHFGVPAGAASLRLAVAWPHGEQRAWSVPPAGGAYRVVAGRDDLVELGAE